LTDDQARRLHEAALTAYNHNLDTSRRHYDKIVTTRSYDDRLETLRTEMAGVTTELEKLRAELGTIIVGISFDLTPP
jgi:biotin synthase-like enzyme